MTKEIQDFYDRLHKLEYSEENIAELFSIVHSLISYLQAIDNDRKTNKCLHFILLTREKELYLLKSAKKSNWEHSFNEAKTNLLADLSHFCSQN